MGIINKIKKIIRLFLPYGIIKISNSFKSGNIYFSEQGEDILLKRYIKKKKGFYVDIGAYNPDIASVTKVFYLRGWNGINIDPNPVSIKIFNKKRKRDINLNYGVADKNSELDFYFFGEKSTRNTFDKITYENECESNKNDVKILKINVMTINNILDKYTTNNQHIDFMNIDVENYEMKILETLNFEKYGPDYLLVEDLTFKDSNIDFMEFNKSPLFQIMKLKGYIVAAKTQYTILFKKLVYSK